MPSKNLNLTEPIKEFVKELNGRYKEYVSDEFLEVLLTEQIVKGCSNIAHPILSNIAYNVGCDIFESILEYKLRAGGNGHHVAQALSAKFA